MILTLFISMFVFVASFLILLALADKYDYKFELGDHVFIVGKPDAYGVIQGREKRHIWRFALLHRYEVRIYDMKTDRFLTTGTEGLESELRLIGAQYTGYERIQEMREDAGYIHTNKLGKFEKR